LEKFPKRSQAVVFGTPICQIFPAIRLIHQSHSRVDFEEKCAIDFLENEAPAWRKKQLHETKDSFVEIGKIPIQRKTSVKTPNEC